MSKRLYLQNKALSSQRVAWWSPWWKNKLKNTFKKHWLWNLSKRRKLQKRLKTPRLPQLRKRRSAMIQSWWRVVIRSWGLVQQLICPTRSQCQWWIWAPPQKRWGVAQGMSLLRTRGITWYRTSAELPHLCPVRSQESMSSFLSRCLFTPKTNSMHKSQQRRQLKSVKFSHHQ